MFGSRLYKKIYPSILVIGMIFSTSGCVYSNNKSFDDMSYEEQQEVIQTLDKVRKELKKDLSNDAVGFALEIVDRVAQDITESSE